MPSITSAAGLLALLSESNDDLKRYALVNLNQVVHDYWFQISGSISLVEALYEDDEFTDRELAALVASKVFYYLGELDDALNYALGAGSLFDVTDSSEYVQSLLARCLDSYFELRVRQEEQKEDVSIDQRLTVVVEKMIERCCDHGQFEQAVGVAIESRRLDKLEEVIVKSSDVKVLKYSLRTCQDLVVSRNFRQQVLRLLVKLYENIPQPDWVDICQCLMFLDDADGVGKILNKLLLGSEEEVLLAYQVGFDLVENEMQSFLLKVQTIVDSFDPTPQTVGVEGAEGDQAAANAAPSDGNGMETDEAAGISSDLYGPQYKERLKHLKDILSGKTPIGLYLEFLYRHNHSDLQILKNIKSAVDARVSVLHSATILTNAYMHAGTTIDTFLRENLDWLSRATNWAKFSATASLGVIHRGHLQQGRALMAPYLPRNAASSSPYSEGGALYALGLIYANHGHEIRQFLLDALRNTNNEVVQHGACLGLGLASLGTEDPEIFEDLKNVLYTDSAVAGEAAGISMGLLMLGSATDKAQEMLAYAHDTQHEKIIRGVAMGLALIMYGREEGAETLIEQMTRDQDPIIRYGAMYVIGMAYRGTDNNAAIQKLLHFAVSDVSDDVRRAAVLCLGFVLMGVPEQCPRIVSLLAESFNPHVRYGAAMAVGLACAGSGLKDAVALLEPMLSDAVDFVRQGALLAMAMVLIQQPESRVSNFRKRVDKFIGDKHEEAMCKMGAIMAAGILDAGGRNVTLGLRSRSGYFRRTSLAGLAMFTYTWYWYPSTYFLSLAMQPTALIGLNAELQMPKMSVTCNCRPSQFAYPAAITQEAAHQVSKKPVAVLSTTAKARERARKKEAAKGGVAAGTEKPAAEAADKAPGDAAAAADAVPASAMETDEVAPKEASSKKDEASSFSLENPARVVPAQVKYVSFPAGSRLEPVKPDLPVGILVLRDLTPGEPCELVASQIAPAPDAPAAAPAPVPAASQPPGDEPPPPEPFEYVPH